MDKSLMVNTEKQGMFKSNKGKPIIYNGKFPSILPGTYHKIRPRKSMTESEFLRMTKGLDPRRFQIMDGGNVIAGMDCRPFNKKMHDDGSLEVIVDKDNTRKMEREERPSYMKAKRVNPFAGTKRKEQSIAVIEKKSTPLGNLKENIKYIAKSKAENIRRGLSRNTGYLFEDKEKRNEYRKQDLYTKFQEAEAEGVNTKVLSGIEKSRLLRNRPDLQERELARHVQEVKRNRAFELAKKRAEFQVQRADIQKKRAEFWNLQMQARAKERVIGGIDFGRRTPGNNIANSLFGEMKSNNTNTKDALADFWVTKRR